MAEAYWLPTAQESLSPLFQKAAPIYGRDNRRRLMRLKATILRAPTAPTLEGRAGLYAGAYGGYWQ